MLPEAPHVNHVIEAAGRTQARTAVVAQRLGVPHAFMVSAIERAALSAENRSKFVAQR